MIDDSDFEELVRNENALSAAQGAAAVVAVYYQTLLRGKVPYELVVLLTREFQFSMLNRLQTPPVKDA